MFFCQLQKIFNFFSKIDKPVEMYRDKAFAISNYFNINKVTGYNKVGGYLRITEGGCFKYKC